MHAWLVFLIVVGGALAGLTYVHRNSTKSSRDDNDDPTSFWG
jgi:uncharacterized membrane protein YidH (DUF202 family)